MPSAETVGSKARVSLAWARRFRTSIKLEMSVVMARTLVSAAVMVRPLVSGFREAKNDRSAESRFGNEFLLKDRRSRARPKAQPKITMVERANANSMSRTMMGAMRSQ